MIVLACDKHRVGRWCFLRRPWGALAIWALATQLRKSLTDLNDARAIVRISSARLELLLQGAAEVVQLAFQLPVAGCGRALGSPSSRLGLVCLLAVSLARVARRRRDVCAGGVQDIVAHVPQHQGSGRGPILDLVSATHLVVASRCHIQKHICLHRLVARRDLRHETIQLLQNGLPEYDVGLVSRHRTDHLDALFGVQVKVY
mmetsp:Transcript_100235/g.282802  ORF Transcript_100235/g.282802 Transcript_100235/m.282802 type:complete len:202 (+) Transcript_100235:165-770(+)